MAFLPVPFHKWSSLLVFIVGYSLAETTLASPPIEVIASIRPVELIVNEIEGAKQVSSLVNAGVSPHDFSLKISDIQRLRQADYVVWLGPEFEGFLSKTVAELNADKVIRLRVDNHESQSGGDDLHSESTSPHLWLDPLAVAEMTATLAHRLGFPVPSASRYESLLRSLQQQLDPVTDKPFVVFHPAYDQWVARFGLNQVGWVQRSSDQPPSAAHLYQLQQAIGRSGARCLLVDESHYSSRVEQLANRLGLFTVRVDILGLKAESYAQLMSSLVETVGGCLAAH